jgi:hypothetical protein
MRMSRPGHFDAKTGTRLAALPAAVSGLHPDDRPGARPRAGSDVADTVSIARQPGHGTAAFMRNQPACIADGHIHGGYNGVYELICPDCGDDPDLNYLEVTPQLQWLRGPRTLIGALTAYHKHLGIPWAEDAAESGPSGICRARGASADDHCSQDNAEADRGHAES